VTGSNELVDATTTSANEPSGSDRIYLSGVTIEGDAIRLALLPKHLCHGLESGLSMKMGVNVRSQQDGGSHIHDMQNFDPLWVQL
jgi:hypothetical protein